VAALVAAGQASDADQFVEAFAGGLHGRDIPAAGAALMLCRAIAAEGAGGQALAAGLFAGAARAWQALPRPYDALLAQERQGICLLAAGQTAAGIGVLSEVFHGLSGLGATAPVERVAGRLREQGADIRREWRRGRRGYGDELSPRELDVVRLVAAGRTNREIARALSRSPNTVAGQLNSAMRKLSVSSRTALAIHAIEAGLSPGNPDHPGR
jgi:DNA-binding CsgD family transcriptional regulator